MERTKIVEMMETARIPSDTELVDLRRLSEEYPYCSTFKVLLALGSKETDDLELRETINLASIYVQDRSKLYDFVVRDSLRKKIEEDAHLEKTGESQSKSADKETSPAKEIISSPEDNALPDAPLREKNEDNASEKTKPNPIKTDLLEEQIMAEAVMHLGELEMESQSEEIGETHAPEPEKDAQEENIGVAEKKRSGFTGWLVSLDKSKETEPQREIIDRFISEDRKITPAKKEFFSPTQMGKMSLMEDDSFVTETLAKIYEKQGDYKKAARAYKNLSLKYPEKRTYFAALQKKAEEKI